MKRKTIWLLSATTLLPFLAIAWVSGPLLGLQGRALWILRGGLMLLGFAAGLLTLLLLRARTARKGEPAASGPAPGEEIDGLLAAAQARLAAASSKSRARLRKLPVVLVLGPRGSTKTTTVVRSGLEPEHLAGHVHGGGAVVPTEAVNVWYAEGTILLEAGGRVVSDADRWAHLVRRLQPARLAAALSRGVQAPRTAVVCFPCDEFLKPGSGEAVPEAARRLRARLTELSNRLGIRLPVYVLFTRADRLPYFDDFVRSLTRAEAQEVLGATLPAEPSTDAGGYADREAARLGLAFNDLFRSLAEKRLDILPREADEEVRAGAYEFPREFRKISDAAVQFLVDLCRPSQLGASPFLRGFYFTGVRAVLVGDSVPPPAASPAASPLDATAVFDARALSQAAHAAARQPHGTRKVPEWTFLPRLFREVVLRDRAAMDATGGGTKVNLLRRALVGATAAALLLLSLGFTTSYVNNRALAREAVAAARDVESVDAAGPAVPDPDALRRLDRLREITARLSGYETEGRPWRVGWGLYTGSRLLPELRRIYFDRFDRLLWTRTRTELLATLRGLPEEPSEAGLYGTTYDALKAHLVTTSHPRESRPEFLTPVLLRYWRGNDEPSAELVDLARRQFDFFGAELPRGNPYDAGPDDAAVQRTRAFLGRFASAEPFYRAMIAEVAEAHEPVRFHDVFPGSEQSLRNRFVVPGAYTRDGWTDVMARLDRVDELLAREDWVVGEHAVPAGDRAALASRIRELYVADYIRHWREFVEAGTVLGYASAGDAARKLAQLSGNQSPLLQLLALASRHTDVDSASVVTRAFQPVHAVVPPEVTDRYIVDGNQAYMAALVGLQASFDEAAGASGAALGDALDRAASDGDQVTIAVRQLAQGFSIEGEARGVGTAVQRLLESPVDAANTVIRRLPSAEVNQKGAEFCRALGPLARRYPFDPRATEDASIDDVSAVFQPGQSALWSLYEEELRDLLVLQGTRYAPRAGATPRPSQAFVAFFNRAAGISRALYDESGSGPEVVFQFRPQTSEQIPEVVVDIDGQRQTFTRTFAAGRTFSWNGARAREARLLGRIDGREFVLAEAEPGPWALFRLFRRATWEDAGNGRYTVRWQFPERGLSLTAEVSFARGLPVFMEGFLGGLGCVPSIAR